MANEQMGMPPAPNSPEGMAVLDQMRQSISPKQFSDEMLASASQVDPQAVAKFKQELDSLDVPPEVLEALNNLVDEILANPDQYDAIRKKYMDQGIPEDILPEQFDPHFFAALNMAVDQLIGAPAGPQAFARGGIAELKPIAKAIAGYGRNGDTMLAHITPAEARMLKRRGGSGTTNPDTGLPEFWNPIKDIGNAFKSIGNAVKSFVNSTVGRIVTTVALGFFLGPAAASMVGIESAAGVAAMSGFVGSAGATLLGGGSLSQALKAGALGGLTAGVMGGVTQGFDAAYTGPTTVAGQWDKLTGAAAAPAGIAPTSAAAQPGITPDVTNLPPANPADFGATQAPGGAPTPAPTSAAPASATQAPGGAPVPPQPPAQIGQPPAAPVTGTSPIDLTNLPPANPADFGATPEPKSLLDQGKEWANKTFNPSEIQKAGSGKALESVKAQFPGVTTEQIVSAPPGSVLAKAYSAAMPGVLGTYGPAVGAGLGIMGLAGGFDAKNPPESALKGQLMKSATQRIAEEGTGKKYYLQGLPGVKYDNAGIPVPGEYLTLPTAQLAAQQRMNLPSTIGGLAALAPKGALYSSLPGSIGSPQVYQPYNTAAMYTNLLRGYAGGGEITPITSNLDNQKLPANFNWEDYVRANPDLARAGIDTREEAENHWINTGLKENRVLNPGELTQRQTAAADLAAQQKASRDAKAQAKAMRRAAGSGNMYANINAGLSALAPEDFPGGPVTLAPEREQAMRTAFAQGNPQNDIDYARIMQQQGYRPEEVAALTGRSFGDINRRYNTALRQDAYAPMLDAQRNARNQQTGIMASTRLPQDISGYTPEQKGGIYMQLARQGLTDPQIRAAAENAYGAQSDYDWKLLQGVVGQMQQPGFQGANMDQLIGQQAGAGNLPPGWSTFSPQQKINYFNQGSVTPDKLSRFGVEQKDIDWMYQHGYTGTPGAQPPAASAPAGDVVSIQGGFDQYGNLYGSKDYHYGRGPTPTQPTPVSDPSYPLAPSPWAPSASDYSQIVGAGTGNSSMADKQALYQRLRASGGTDQQIRSLAEKLLGPQTNEAWSLLSQAPAGDVVSIQGGLDQYGNLYGSQDYHYGRGPAPATPPKAMLNAGGIAALATGGYPRMNGQISGPGTEKSDSIPAMLSDGEFVMTAKAVRGAGKGSRREGAKRMYELMHRLEKNAARG